MSVIPRGGQGSHIEYLYDSASDHDGFKRSYNSLPKKPLNWHGSLMIQLREGHVLERVLVFNGKYGSDLIKTAMPQLIDQVVAEAKETFKLEEVVASKIHWSLNYRGGSSTKRKKR